MLVSLYVIFQRKLIHSLSVCPCLSQTLFAHTFCMWLHCCDMLSCPEKQMKTAISSSWERQPHKFSNSKYLLYIGGTNVDMLRLPSSVNNQHIQACMYKHYRAVDNDVVM